MKEYEKQSKKEQVSFQDISLVTIFDFLISFNRKNLHH